MVTREWHVSPSRVSVVHNGVRVPAPDEGVEIRARWRRELGIDAIRRAHRNRRRVPAGQGSAHDARGDGAHRQRNATRPAGVDGRWSAEGRAGGGGRAARAEVGRAFSRVPQRREPGCCRRWTCSCCRAYRRAFRSRCSRRWRPTCPPWRPASAATSRFSTIRVRDARAAAIASRPGGRDPLARQRPARRHEIGAGGRRRVEEAFSLRRMIGAYESLYASLVN